MPRLAATLTALTLVLAGCASDTGDPATDGTDGAGARFTVVTDMYPTTYAVQQVVGDDVEVVQIVPDGVEPHDYELSPGQVREIADADLVAHIPGIIPAVDQAVEQEAEGRSVDVTAAITRLAGGADDHADEEGDDHADEEGDDHADEEHADGDPHVWLDPRNMAAMGSTAAEALTALGIDADAGSLSAEMDALHAELSAALATCTIEPMVVSHEAFGYLADAYGFTQVGISGLTPESEPSPRKLAEISDLVRAEGITTIYFEALASPAAAQAIAAETGVATALLDPIESSTDGKAYPVLMDENRAALAAGQGCS